MKSPLVAFLLSGLLLSEAYAKSPTLTTPEASIELAVDDVTPTGSGRHIVFLTDKENTRIVPIPVGESEAITIAFRLSQRINARPHTHDVLDELLRGLDASVLQVHIHTLENNTFKARITVRRKRTLLHLDARAADGVAIALGHNLPLFMDQGVYEEASIGVDELLQSLERGLMGIPMTTDDVPL